jgi:RNA polymerase sigma-70 factor (ECF subfamily)
MSESDLTATRVTTRMSNPIQSEDTLLARACKLDAHALAQIHDLYYPQIYWYALIRTNDKQEAEDIASEVFLRLLNALHSNKSPQHSLKGWLFGVASHLVADHFRRRPSLPIEESLPGSSSPAAEVEERLRLSEVLEAMQALTEDQREVLALRFGNSLSIEETAHIMKKTVTAVKALQFRAVEALRQKLSVSEEDG